MTDLTGQPEVASSCRSCGTGNGTCFMRGGWCCESCRTSGAVVHGLIPDGE